MHPDTSGEGTVCVTRPALEIHLVSMLVNRVCLSTRGSTGKGEEVGGERHLALNDDLPADVFPTSHRLTDLPPARRHSPGVVCGL